MTDEEFHGVLENVLSEFDIIRNRLSRRGITEADRRDIIAALLVTEVNRRLIENEV